MVFSAAEMFTYFTEIRFWHIFSDGMILKALSVHNYNFVS